MSQNMLESNHSTIALRSNGNQALRVTFCKTDAPEIHDPLDLLEVCIVTRNASCQNFSFLTHLLSKLQHPKNASTSGQIAVFMICVLLSDSHFILAYY